MIYLDNAATTFPKPQSVVKNVVDAVKVYGGNPGRSGHAISLRTSEKIYGIRETISRFFGVSMEQVVFTSNCSHALNMAIKGALGEGGHVITSHYEHNSVIRPLYALKQKDLIDYDCAQVYAGDDDATVQSFERLIRPNTKAVVCTHASNVTGVILPVAKIGEMCRRHGLIFIVDGAQSAGVLPVNLQEMNIDIFCTAGHKGLYGTTGTGLMLLGSDKQYDTIMEGGTGSVSEDLAQPDFLPDRFESGTINTVGILSMGAGLKHISHIGQFRIYQHEFSLCRYVYDELSCMPFVETYVDSYEKNLYAPIVLFNIKGKSSTEVVDIMSRQGIALRGGLHCAPMAHEAIGTLETGAVRVSPSVFTTKRDMMVFLRTLKQISKYGNCKCKLNTSV